MTTPDHPAGIIETMLESIEENNHRLNTLESKIDRIWEIVAKLSSDFTRIAKPSIKQLALFDDDSAAVEKDELEFQPNEPSRLEPEIASPPEIEFDEEVLEKTAQRGVPDGMPPHWQDKEVYKKYTVDLIFKLKNAGMTLKEMAEELNNMGLKSRSGKDSWSFSMVNSVLQQGQKG